MHSSINCKIQNLGNYFIKIIMFLFAMLTNSSNTKDEILFSICYSKLKTEKFLLLIKWLEKYNFIT